MQGREKGTKGGGFLVVSPKILDLRSVVASPKHLRKRQRERDVAAVDGMAVSVFERVGCEDAGWDAT